MSSFDLLKKELVKIKDAWGYKSLVRRLLAEIERINCMPSGGKDVSVFLPLLQSLEKKLEHDVQGYPIPGK